jgi:cytidylate kinase
MSQRPNGLIIAIDGPASSGKSTTAKELAKRLKYVYIDTGAMYRACALFALNSGVSLNDLAALGALLDTIQIDIRYAENGNRILLNGDDVSERIREADISKLSSEIAVIGLVRSRMVDLQRKLGEKGGIIMDGRDIGTVVFPNADLKIFMIADVETRAQRRFEEMKEKGASLEEIRREIEWRDHNDSSREIAPLRKADDAVELDTSHLRIEQQVEAILNYATQKL